MNDTLSQTISNRTLPKGWTIALWAAQVVLAIIYLLAGGMKLSQPIPALAAAGMGFVLALPEAAVRLIGLAEVLGAIGVVAPALTRIRPSLTPLAAAGLVLLQICAAIFHATRGEFFMLPANTVLLALALFVWWGRSRKAPILPR